MTAMLHAKSPQSWLNFSSVDSQEQVIALACQRELVTILLMPLKLGGFNTVHETLYIPPPDIRDIKTKIDRNIVGPLAKVGKITEYVATPAYQDISLVPIAINILATNPGRFFTTIPILGKALMPEQPQ